MAQPQFSPILPMTDVVLTTVQPLHKTAHVESIDATYMDLPSTDVYISVFFAYRLESKSEAVYSQVVKGIKESLQKVLLPFFSFAGRWAAVPQGSRRRKLLCNDEGVPFIEAFVGKDLDSVLQASTAFQPVPELQGFEHLGMDAVQVTQRMPSNGLPPTFVQITRFQCGGLVLAVAFNHMHTDAKGFFNFMTAWSDISRTNLTTVRVDHNRAQVDIPEMSARDLSHSVSPYVQPSKVQKWVMRAFEVERSLIEALKQEAKDGDEGGGYLSTGDCIVAHMWRSFASLPSSLLGDKELAVGLVVEGRTRVFDPPLPNLCGNVLSGMVAPEIAVKEVQKMPLVSLARQLRNKLVTTKREDWRDLQRMAEVAQTLWGNNLACLFVTSWFKFPMYEMDFGFGKPYFASGPNYVHPGNRVGAIYIGPPIPSSSNSVAIVYLTSTPEVFAALEQNPQFSTFFSGDLHR